MHCNGERCMYNWLRPPTSRMAFPFSSLIVPPNTSSFKLFHHISRSLRSSKTALPHVSLSVCIGSSSTFHWSRLPSLKIGLGNVAQVAHLQATASDLSAAREAAEVTVQLTQGELAAARDALRAQEGKLDSLTAQLVEKEVAVGALQVRVGAEQQDGPTAVQLFTNTAQLTINKFYVRRSEHLAGAYVKFEIQTLRWCVNLFWLISPLLCAPSQAQADTAQAAVGDVKRCLEEEADRAGRERSKRQRLEEEARVMQVRPEQGFLFLVWY